MSDKLIDFKKIKSMKRKISMLKKKSNIDTKDRYSFANEKWRKAVYKKDNHKCQCCGRKHIKLCAHHIKGFSNNIDKRFDIDNGISLCISCHIKFHNKYGKVNFPDIKHTEFYQKWRNK